MNCAFRKERRGAPEGVGTFTNILRRDGVTDIYHLHIRANAVDHTLHNAYKAVTESKTGGEGNECHACPYVGGRGWVGIDLDRISDKDLIFQIQVAWELVAPKRLLSKIAVGAGAPQSARKQRGT